MARIRSIKPEFWKHEDLSSISEPALLLAVALLNAADDEGYFNANIQLIKAECFPIRELSVSLQDAFNELSKIGYVEFYPSVDGKNYGRIVNFTKHQKINRPTPSKIKEKTADHGAFSERSRSVQ